MPSPNLSDAILEAGGTVYARKSLTETPTALLSVDTNGVAQVGAGQSAVNIATLQLAGTLLGATSTELDAVADLSAINVARTATSGGLTTGTITSRGVLNFVTVTSANADHIITLPAPTPGTIVILRNGGTGYELRTSDPATISINGGAGAEAESAIAANTMVIAICTTATTWQAISLVGTTLAAVEAAA